MLALDLPPTDQDLFGYTSCAYCNKPMPLTAAKVVMLFTSDEVAEQEHVCSDEHGQAWRLSKIGQLL